jgi:hypothetical protein
MLDRSRPGTLNAGQDQAHRFRLSVVLRVGIGGSEQTDRRVAKRGRLAIAHSYKQVRLVKTVNIQGRAGIAPWTR